MKVLPPKAPLELPDVRVAFPAAPEAVDPAVKEITPPAAKPLPAPANKLIEPVIPVEAVPVVRDRSPDVFELLMVESEM